MANEQTLEEQYPDLSKAYGPGKFSTYLDVYLHELVGNGCCDEETGDCSTQGIWYGLFRGNFEHPQLFDVAGAIISENDQGFVSARTFQDSASLEKAWFIILDTTDTDDE